MIIVLGQPRTGTTSVATALNLMGLSVLQYCPITNTNFYAQLHETLNTGITDYEAIVSSDFTTSSITAWLRLFPDAHFIHCTRNESTRARSLQRTGSNINIRESALRACVSMLESSNHYHRLDCDWPDAQKLQLLQQIVNPAIDPPQLNEFPHTNRSAI